MRMNEISVFGGTNMDVLGSPSQEMNLRDSNLGHVQLQVGGVGHNIAARIAAHNISCVLFTAIGNDCLSDVIRIDCEKDNIDISHALKTDGRCCIYLAVHDSDGDMLVALNDMEAASYMDSGYVQRILPLINESRLCVIDTNPPAESIAYLVENARIPILCDPVSCVKSARIREILPYLSAIKPNLSEAKALTGEKDVRDCATSLHKKGVEKVFISLGSEGLYCSDGQISQLLPVKRISRVPVTGAGDSLTAGIAIAMSNGESTISCAKYGMTIVEEYLRSREIEGEII